MKSLLVLSAVALAAPAAAQTAGAPASTNAAQPTTPATPATPAPQPATDAPGAQAATSATPANSTDAVAQVVSTDWSKYDADTNESLSKAEFGKWMTALQEQAPAAQKAQAKPTGWTDAAFTQADKDKSGTVSKTELQAFLKG